MGDSVLYNVDAFQHKSVALVRNLSNLFDLFIMMNSKHSKSLNIMKKCNII